MSFRDRGRLYAGKELSMSLPVQLTVRGTLAPKSLEAARILHNDTAGSPQGIAAARSLGDLSHKVFAPCLRSGGKDGELLFLDVWCDPQGIGQFFSNANTQEQAAKMFTAKDATIWMRATGSYSYHLPSPRGKDTRFVGMVRGPIASPEKAIEIFAGIDAKAVRDARKRGLLSHDIFIKVPMPGDTSGPELLGLDVWVDHDGMTEHYADQTHMAALGKAFSGPPSPSVWEQAPGAWSEW
jgi:hypothetical protein